MKTPMFFAGARIDRADQTRVDPAALADAMGSPSARLLRLDGIDPQEDGQGQLVWGSLAEAEPDADMLFLGMDDGRPRFATLPPADVAVDARSRSCWRILPHLAPDQAALYGGARSLIDWHCRHRFCANCGAPTEIAKGGWQRTCPACRAEHFPRTDPVVIMLAEHGDAVLVGRQPGWAQRQYSALAGFLEPGESVEEAVARELWEETGVRARDVRYIGSQPWPFPSSLMIGCIAQADARDLKLDETEIEDAIWVTRADVAAALRQSPDASFTAPPPHAIAHALLAHWLEG